ncbi:MAG: response regulator [Desulfatitalea sp.]|nr:response regulator [Desulfatitalea sp.]NNK01318.1 response regulator [Desulfatitalea sp.]
MSKIIEKQEKAHEKERPTILVAEDDAISMKCIKGMLTEAGFRVQTATDGRRCLNNVAHLMPDLVIMDVVMPNLDGIQACRLLKADSRFQRIPVIFVTGNTDDRTLKSAFSAGGSDYVRKPVSRIEILARVRTALAQQRMILQLTEEEKLKSVLETAGGICHELNQPLQYVLGAVQLLMLDVPLHGEIYNQLDAIRARVEQMGGMMHKLSEITRVRTRKYVGNQDIVDLQGSIDDSRWPSKDEYDR